MSSNTFTLIVLRKRPEAEILPDTFESQTVSKDVLKPGPGEIVVQVTYLSLDPAMRGWLRDTRSYLPPVQIGEMMRAVGLGNVVEVEEGSLFARGDAVSGLLDWTEFTVLKDEALQKITPPPGTTELDFLNTLGLTGMTAYFGLHDVGQVKAGETLLVSGAAGATGSIVCQLGKRAGAKVVALAGSDNKKNFKNAVGYLDVFFDNVGGETLDLALKHLNQGARIALCGAISAYNSPTPRGLKKLFGPHLSASQDASLDYAPQFPKAIADLAAGLANGTIKRKFHIVGGLQNAPTALLMLFSGENTGKLVIQVSSGQPSGQPLARF